jgi:serine/threonine protein kinase
VREINANGALSYERIETMCEQSLFIAALERDPSERDAFLESACAGNVSLRGRVEKLLLAHEHAANFMEEPAAGQAATIDEPITERPGTVIGPYKLMEQIGEGGMGLVFVAEQQQPIRRRVALKVIKPGMDTRQVIARFEAERQALALMDHPNIAKVHDGGETASGRPYFVMELVKAVPITEYCDQNEVPVRQRLELFLHVCQAVQHAHQKGIIHRDIKPSNVLVMSDDGRPLVKVIDFGVAKAVGQQLTDKTIYTQFTQLVGTPLYMSPEQAGQSGRDVDSRSDIYSLGVLLYELLTGTTPFDKERLKDASYEEIRRIIREEEPPKPSTRISTLGQAATTVSIQRKSDPKRLCQLVRGDLDWIVMKTLEKDRNHRYETASALAADVELYLHDEPVLACPPSALYRFRKFARRNRVALGMASVATGALLLLLIGLAAGVLVLGRQRNEIRKQRDKAIQEVDDYFTQVSENKLLKSPLPGLQPLRKELLETALKYYQGFIEEHPDDPALQAEMAGAYFRVGIIRSEIGVTSEAFQAFQAARDLLEQQVRENPADRQTQGRLAECLRRMGQMQVNKLGQPAKGLQALQRAQDIYEKLTGAEPNNHDFQSGLAQTYFILGLGEDTRQEGPDQLQWYEKARDIWQRLARADPKFCSELGTTTISIGYYYTQAGKPLEALASFEQARQILVQLCHDHPRDTALLVELRRVHINIGYVHHSLTGHYEDALRAYDQSRLIVEQLTRENPAVTDFQTFKAGIYKQMGELHSDMKHFAQAEEYHLQALAILDQLIQSDNANTRLKHWQGGTHVQLARAQLNSSDRSEEALANCQKAQRILQELLNSDPNQVEYSMDLSECYEVTALVYKKMGRREEAIQSYQQAIGCLEKIPEDSWEQNERLLKAFTKFYTALGEVERTAGQRAQAERSYRHVLDIREKYFTGKDRMWRTLSYFYPAWISLGQLQIDSGKREEARQTLQQARTLMEKVPQPKGEDLYGMACVRSQLSRLAGLGQITLAAPEQAERLQCLDQAMDALRKAITSGYRDLAELQKDTSLNPLRDRDDFHKLVAGLQAAKEKEKK